MSPRPIQIAHSILSADFGRLTEEIETITKAVQFAQDTVDALDRGDPPPAFDAESGSDNNASTDGDDDLDAELLNAWSETRRDPAAS